MHAVDPLHGILASAASSVPPARGAALHQILVASLVALVLAVILTWIALATHSGRLLVVRQLGEVSERISGLPAWAGLPLAIGAVSLIVAAFGFYWDVSWHIDRGRDLGPFANPAHWFIIVGLAGIVVAGLVSVALGSNESRTAIRFRSGWTAPLGGVLVLVCGAIALAGFPLDDLWHALFGQDVTLWGPTHIQMIGGASLATLALWILLEEGRRARAGGAAKEPWLIRNADVLLGGAFLMGLSTLQAEFDFGVPQFRQLYHPVLLMLAASIGLVAVRIRTGRGGALGAGAFIGTVGLAAEWGWSHVWMPFPWTSALWPEGAVLGLVAAIAGGLLGGLTGAALAGPRVAVEARGRASPWLVAGAGVAAA